MCIQNTSLSFWHRKNPLRCFVPQHDKTNLYSGYTITLFKKLFGYQYTFGFAYINQVVATMIITQNMMIRSKV